MARRQRQYMVTSQFITVTTTGESDTTLTILTAGGQIPFAGARIDTVWATQAVVGGTTGTFTIQIMDGAVALTPAGITIDADAAAGVIHGSMRGNGVAAVNGGGQVGVATVKTGTVSDGPVLQITILWQM